jgi:signal transduction histidine kinase/DNA-binding response OmpR family regulator
MHPFLKKVVEYGNHPDDSEEEKANKSNLVVLAIPFSFAGLIWGLLYYMNDLLIPAAIPFSYGVLSLISYLHFGFSKKYKFYRNSQLFLILLLPFLLQLSLGGFIQSSAVIMWAFIAPVGALVFFKAQQTIVWFVGYLVLVVLAFFINDALPEYFNWELSDQFINVVFVLNILAVSGLIYAVQYYYVNKQTELKESIEEKSKSLAEQAEKLKESDKLKSRFFANVSHEFRTPLTLILGLLNKQKEHADRPPSLQDTETMQRNANRLLQLINQLLDLSKVEGGELKLAVIHKDVVATVKKTALLYDPLGFEKNIKIFFNGKPMDKATKHKPIAAYFDEEKLNKVVSNLISNAIKFNLVEGVIEIQVKEENKVLYIIIANTGEKIPSKNMPYIFNRFYQVDGTSTRVYEGTGIGLSLVKELVELHHGTVEAKSTPSRTTFTLTLPLEHSYFSQDHFVDEPTEIEEITIPMVDANPTKIKPQEIGNVSENGQLEILVVEDNTDIRNYIHDILEPFYKVVVAVDGEDGLEKANASIPDLIVSDVMMPKMNGYEMCEQLKTTENTNHIPVILLTAKASQENKMEGLETGADDYLTKPFDNNELKVRIKNLISLREKLQKKYQQESLLKPNEVKVNSVQQKFLQKIKNVVESNMDNSEFNVEELGDQLYMSRSQIHRKLKALTNQSATQYIRNYRLHRAADLLKQDSGNVTEIAYQVGFSSQTYFSKCFQELFHCSPSEFKNQ